MTTKQKGMVESNGKHPYHGERNSRSQRQFSKFGIKHSGKAKKELRRAMRQIEQEINQNNVAKP